MITIHQTNVPNGINKRSSRRHEARQKAAAAQNETKAQVSNATPVFNESQRGRNNIKQDANANKQNAQQDSTNSNSEHLEGRITSLERQIQSMQNSNNNNKPSGRINRK